MKLFATSSVVIDDGRPSQCFLIEPAESPKAALANFLLKNDLTARPGRSVADIKVKEIDADTVQVWMEAVCSKDRSDTAPEPDIERKYAVNNARKRVVTIKGATGWSPSLFIQSLERAGYKIEPIAKRGGY